MKAIRSLLAAALVLGMLVPGASAVLAGGEEVQAKVLRRGRARPDGTKNIGVYVRTRAEYREQWERFGFRGERPDVNFKRRRVAFVGTTESSSCPLRFRRATLHREEKRLTVHLNDGASKGEGCTDDLVHRSFVISLRKASLPRGDLSIRIRRH